MLSSVLRSPRAIQADPLPYSFAPLTPDRWPDLEAIFRAKGCSVARGCWCMAYHLSGAPEPSSSQTILDRNIGWISKDGQVIELAPP